jgi:hypothetical protein
LGTPNINKLLTKNRLRKTILNNNILEAAQDIQSSLTGFKPDLSFGGILFQLKNKQEEKEAINSNSDETNYRPTSKPQEEKISSNILAKSGKFLVNFFSKLVKYIWSFLLKIKDIFLGLFLLITNQGGQRKTITKNIKQSFSDRRREFRELPVISKALLIVALLAGLSFVGSLSYIKIKEAKRQEIQQTQNKVKTVQKKIDSAKAELIYDNDKKALTILTDAQNKLDKLPNNLQSIKQNFPSKEKLEGKITSKLNKARNITTVSSTLVVNLAKKTNKKKPNKLAFIKDKLISYNPKSNQTYLVDKTTKSITNKKYTALESLTHDATPKENDYIVFSSKNKAVKLTPDPYNFSLQEIDFPSDNPSIAGLAIYSRNLYTIDKKSNQIFKHSPIQGGFSTGEPWIKKSTSANLKNAKSLAIDGNIYVLKNNGQIEKFFTGEREKFNVSGVSPKLSNPTEIWTYRDVDNIYVLEPTKKRVVILNKEGKIIKQLKGKEWSNPTNMIIEEKKNTGYVIDNGKIYKFSLKL